MTSKELAQLGMCEEEISAEYLETILLVCKRTAPQFKFGIFSVEDLEQEAIYECLMALRNNKYDPSLPLENFLQVHVRNRLLNVKRNNGHRNEPPCKSCPLWDKRQKSCMEYGADRLQCVPFAAWNKKSTAKKNIISPASLVGLENVLNTVADSETEDTKAFLHFVDENLAFEFRENYLKSRAGVNVNKGEKENLITELKRLASDWKNFGEPDAVQEKISG